MQSEWHQTRAGLVPFTLHKPLLEELQVLAGVAVPSVITAEKGTVFPGNFIFTPPGFSGPAGVCIFPPSGPGGEFMCSILSAVVPA
ncbi:hypothetical protein AV889_26550, partial [Escherichia coli]